MSAGGTPASAAIDTSATALQLAQAIVADPSTLAGASFVTVPPSGTPNGVSTTPIAGFPTARSDYAILTSGDASLAAQPPGTNPGGTNDNGGNVRGNTDYDVTILKVDVNVPAGDNCLLGFDFKFLSEEYPQYVGTQYNDAFIAELDHSTWTTNGSQISAPDNFAFDPAHNPITINAAGPASMTAQNSAGTPYGGATPTLSASTPITPGAHSIYFSIFDQGDHILDSAVFIDNLTFGSVADPATQCVPGAHAASWTPLGPNFVTDTRLAPSNSYVESGRVTALAPDPASKSIYAGTVGGGVWRVDTSNATWTPLSDNAPSLSIGALALSRPSTGGTFLLAGTGEQAEPRSYGIGIMRGVIAADGSVSWSVVASLPGASVQQIVVDPNDPDRLLAATSDGLYASTDSGITWVQRLPGNFTAVASDPSLPGSFLVAQTSGVDHAACSAKIWQGPFFAAGPPAISYPATGLSSGPFAANVALASSPTQSFALVSDCSGKFNASLAYAQAGNSGNYHWKDFATSAFTGNGSALGIFGGGPKAAVGQGNFDNVIAAVPGASCDVIVGGVELYRVTTNAVPGGCNGKPTVTPLSQNHTKMHEDMHALAFDNGTLYVGNDGGLWSTPSLTAPAWTTWHGGLNARQSISTFYQGEALDSTHLIGGLQDDGTVSTLASGNTSSWSQASAGGDGGYSYAWAGAPRYFQQTLDTWDYTNRNAGPIGACYTINTAVFPYQCANGNNAQIPDPPLLVDTLENAPNKLLEATDQVYLSTSGGGSNGSGWTNSSGHANPALIASPGYIAGLGFTCGTGCPDYIAAAAVDWKASGGPKIFTASAFGAVRMATSTFIGQNWQDIGTGLPQPSPGTKISGLPWVSGVAIDPCIWSSSNGCGNNHEAWITLQENGRGAVYHTNDYTQSPPSWTAVGTFNTPVTSLAVASTPNGDNNHVDLYVGTANEGVLTCGGCYGDAPHVNWSQVGNGLPDAWVSNVSCSTDGKSLIAWTYGRGAWAASIPSSPTGCVSSQQSDSFR